MRGKGTILCRFPAILTRLHSSKWSRHRGTAERIRCRSWLPTSNKCLSTYSNNSQIYRIWRMEWVQYVIWKPWTADSHNPSHPWLPHTRAVETATLLSLLRTKWDQLKAHLNARPPLPFKVVSHRKTQEISDTTMDLPLMAVGLIRRASIMSSLRERAWPLIDLATAPSTIALSQHRKQLYLRIGALPKILLLVSVPQAALASLTPPLAI